MKRLISVLLMFVMSAPVMAGPFGILPIFRSRCSSGYCPPKRVYKKRVVKEAAPVTTVFAFNNAVPIQATGSTQYSVGTAISPYTTQAADFLHLGYRQSDNIQSLTQAALTQAQSEVEVNRVLATSQAMSQVINAMREETAHLSSQNQSWGFVVRQQGGKVVVEPLPGPNAQPGEVPQLPDAPGVGVAGRCISCHGGENPKAGLNLADPNLPPQTRLRALYAAQFRSGVIDAETLADLGYDGLKPMPPAGSGPALTVEELGRLKDYLFGGER